MPTLLILGAALAFAIALLASSASASLPDRSPMFSFCGGRVAQVPDVRTCPDGSLRIVR
jgi:hypothetical protein